MPSIDKLTGLAVTASLLAGTAAYSEEVLNLYTSRHYDTDVRLLSDFTDMTGIKIEMTEGKPDELIARILSQGDNTEADIFLTVDTTRLERAKAEGVLQAVDSDVLSKRIPSHLRDKDNKWFGFSQRARIIFYDKNDVADPPLTYVDLADPKYKGMVCHRSSSNVYSQTLMSAIIENHGEEAAKGWAQGFVDNFARDPEGGDTDQLRGLVSGECDIAISNTYYFARAVRKDVDRLGKEDLGDIGWVFPAQDAEGAHINLSGGGVVANAPHKENAIKFMEYLASDSAQQYFSAGNDEYPAVAGVAISPSVAMLGMFKPDDVQASAIAENLEAAQVIFNEVGWK
ncbi:MAG: extracellular solute-binding protein [Pseudomonadota bacterium]